MASPPSEGARLVAALRERLLRGLHELTACRALLELHDLPCDVASFSARPEDHADVLECPVPVTEDSWAVDADMAVARRPSTPSSASSTCSPVAALRAAAAAPAAEQEPAERAVAAASSSSSQAGLAAEPAFAAEPAGAEPAAEPAGEPAGAEANARSIENLEEELSVAKALLMLKNVNLHMDFDRVEVGADTASAAQVVRLKGNSSLIQMLITLKQKVSLLNQQYLLLRGDMLYLSHEMSVCRHWILQSFRTAMQHQSNEHSSLQTRFERLSKVLN